MKLKKRSFRVKGFVVGTYRENNADYISLTDIAKFRSRSETDDVIKNWVRNRSTIDFLGLWEKINNPDFNSVEFDGFKYESGTNTFVLTPKKWIVKTNAIGLISKSGRYNGGTFAHKDIAFEFASWISAEFKLYLIKEFQRLKEDESRRLSLGWDLKRAITKINYKIHTDAIKLHLVPKVISKKQSKRIYASEADLMNVALFGKTAKKWREQNHGKKGNIRDYADVSQLVVLANLEGINAELIRQGMTQHQRIVRLNEVAIIQMQSLLDIEIPKIINL